MTDVTIPATKLDAVNLMLASIGQTPLNSLDTSGIRDAAIAELSLDMTTRQVLSSGWSFNTDRNYEIATDVSDNILVPANALYIEPSSRSYAQVERDNAGTRMMWDLEEHTFTITVSPIEYDIIRAYEFNEIPQAARGYIATRAARLFQSQVIGSDILFKYTEIHERESFATFQKLERRAKNHNIFGSATDHNAIIRRSYSPLR